MWGKIIDAVLSALALGAITLAGFVFSWSYGVNKQIWQLQQTNENLQSQIDDLNKARTASLKYIWTEVAWTQKYTIILFFKLKLDPPPPPEFQQ